MAEPNLSLSFITSACEHTSTQTARRRGKCVCGMCICDAAVQLSLRSEEHVPFYTAQSLTPPLLSQDKHFQLVSQTLQMRFNGCHRLCLSLVFSLFFPLSLLFFPLTVTSLVSWDRVARETRPQTGPLRQRSPKHRTAQLSSEKLLLCFPGSLAAAQQAYLQSRADLQSSCYTIKTTLLKQ